MLSWFLIYFLPQSVIYHLKCIWLLGICNTIPPIFSLELSVMFYGRIKRCLEKRHWNAESVNIRWKHKTKTKTILQKPQAINNEHSYRYQINMKPRAHSLVSAIITIKDHSGPRATDVNYRLLSWQFKIRVLLILQTGQWLRLLIKGSMWELTRNLRKYPRTRFECICHADILTRVTNLVLQKT